MESDAAATDSDVLIVDGDLAFVAFLSSRIESESGFRVAGFATKGHEGVQLAQGITPDVIVSDYHLPDVDGLALIQQLRLAAPAAAIVVYTGAWSDNVLHEARLGGADDCVDKAMQPRDLIRLLREARRGRRRAASA